MKRVYICSPYKAKDKQELDRNIEYARLLTRQALDAGFAPITPHLYLTQCTSEDKPEERAAALAAGLELLKCCDYVIVGRKYGVSEGMSGEIEAAVLTNILVLDTLYFEAYANHCACNYCKGRHLHSCTGYDCKEPYQKAFIDAQQNYGEAFKYAQQHYGEAFKYAQQHYIDGRRP